MGNNLRWHHAWALLWERQTSYLGGCFCGWVCNNCEIRAFNCINRHVESPIRVGVDGICKCTTANYSCQWRVSCTVDSLSIIFRSLGRDLCRQQEFAQTLQTPRRNRITDVVANSHIANFAHVVYYRLSRSVGSVIHRFFDNLSEVNIILRGHIW